MYARSSIVIRHVKQTDVRGWLLFGLVNRQNRGLNSFCSLVLRCGEHKKHFTCSKHRVRMGKITTLLYLAV